MGYKQEIDALGRWVYQVAGLASHRLSSAPPKVARPVILWETPTRTKGDNFGNYLYTRRTSQFGKLYVNTLDQLADLMDKLEKDLGDRNEYLPVYATDQAAAEQIGRLQKVQLDFNTSQNVDVPITIRYESVYSRPIPIDPGPATFIGTTFNLTEGGPTNE